MPRTPPKKKTLTNGRKRVNKPYAARAREYEALMEQIGLNQLETGKLFEFAGRTSRRYKRGEGKVPLTALILMRLMAKGVITKRQVIRASTLEA
jgi:hypothetical protein